VVGVEVAGERGLVGVLDLDADSAPAHHQVVGPAHRTAGTREALGQHAARRGLERDSQTGWSRRSAGARGRGGQMQLGIAGIGGQYTSEVAERPGVRPAGSAPKTRNDGATVSDPESLTPAHGDSQSEFIVYPGGG
jgi:hypothetical protein